MIKRFCAALLSVVLVLCLFGCGSKSESLYNVNAALKNDVADEIYGDGFESNSSIGETNSASTSTQDYLESQKLIYTCDISMQTVEFDKTIESIKSEINKCDGFIESEKMSDDAYGWYYSDYEKRDGTLSASITIRIPTESYSDFINKINGHGKIVSKSEKVTNITKQYNATSSTIKMLEKEESMLLDMMEECTTISEMITVEERLSKVQQQLAIYNNELNDMNTDIELSTINLFIEEVIEYSIIEEEQNFLSRVWNAMISSIKSFLQTMSDILILAIYILPYVIIAIVIFILISSIYKKKKLKFNKKANETKENTSDVSK